MTQEHLENWEYSSKQFLGNLKCLAQPGGEETCA